MKRMRATREAPLSGVGSDPHIPGLRSDIQALRAVAVGSVMTYHLWPGVFRGGFVGVDVFFVISGFLITGHLANEAYATGRIRLGRFWAKRAKRLLPASMLVLVTVAIATVTIVPISLRANWLREVVGSTFYVQNWVLASRSVDYLHQGDTESPLLHFWTLSVEEQFYIVIPLVLTALALLPLVRSRLRLAVPVTICAILVASLAYSIHLTETRGSVAFFSTGTRAWEFGVGSLIAVTAFRVPRAAQLLVGWAGAVAIAASVWFLSGTTPFPGYAGALPVLGAAGVIVAAGRGPVGLMATWRPITFLGDISYSIYLWHWPPIVLLPILSGHALNAPERVAVLLGAILAAWASTRFVEDPLRFLPVHSRPHLLSVGIASLLVMGAVSGSAFAAIRVNDATISRMAVAADEAINGATGQRCLGAAVMLPGADLSGCPDYGTQIFPNPSAAHDDQRPQGSCLSVDEYDPTPGICTFPGGKPGEPSILVIGDSHSVSLIEAYKQIAVDAGWNIDMTARIGCGWTNRTQEIQPLTYRATCDAWHERISDLLARGKQYEAIVTTSVRGLNSALPERGETPEEAAIAGQVEAWTPVIDRGTLIVALRDVPHARDDVIRCVERQRLQADKKCVIDEESALAGQDYLSQAAAITSHSSVLDLTDAICRNHVCSPVIGHVAVYRDTHHLTATFARSLVPILHQRLIAAMSAARADTQSP